MSDHQHGAVSDHRHGAVPGQRERAVVEAFAASFGRLCAGTVSRLLDRCSPPGGGRLLDVGTGTGTVARAAARRGLRVVGVDPDPAMIAYAREPGDADLVATGSADLVVGTLPHLPWADDTFDAVVANFVINHVADPRSGVREMRRVCMPGGRVGCTIWPSGPSALNQLWSAVAEAAGAHEVTVARLPDHLDFPRTETGLRGLLADGGLEDVVAESVELTFQVDAADLWSGVEAGIATIGARYLAQDEHTRQRMRGAYDDLSQQFGADGPTSRVLSIPATAVLAVGTAAGS